MNRRPHSFPAALLRSLGLCALVMTAVIACSGEPPIRIDDRVLTIACGRCIFEMPDLEEGCPWAAEVDGKHYLIQGDVPHDHNSHEATGICNMPRQARVRGEIRGETLYVSKVELLEPESVPESPRFTPADIH